MTDDNKNINALILALQDQTRIMSETYTGSTKMMCKTIENLDKSKVKQHNRFIAATAIIVLGMLLMFFIFMIFLYYAG